MFFLRLAVYVWFRFGLDFLRLDCFSSDWLFMFMFVSSSKFVVYLFWILVNLLCMWGETRILFRFSSALNTVLSRYWMHIIWYILYWYDFFMDRSRIWLDYTCVSWKMIVFLSWCAGNWNSCFFTSEILFSSWEQVFKIWFSVQRLDFLFA